VVISNTVEVGKTVAVICGANAVPPASYMIIHNSTEVVSIENRYTINPVEYSHAGSYRCIAKNKFGNNSGTINFTVSGISCQRLSVT
jgi:hypothetical protein